MNPSGLRIEEKKSADASFLSHEERSLSSYKSTQSSRSSVLQRAREYNRRIDAQNMRRSKSLERSSLSEAGGSAVSGESSRRSLSTGRAPSSSRGTPATNRLSTRERALASVRKESGPVATSSGTQKMAAARHVHSTPTDPTMSDSFGPSFAGSATPRTTSTTTPLRPTAVVPASSRSNTKMEPYNRSSSTPKPVQQRHVSPHRNASPMPSPQSQQRHGTQHSPWNHNATTRPSGPMNRVTSSSRTLPVNNLSSPSTRSFPSSKYSDQPTTAAPTNTASKPQKETHETGVSPELLVDALSGHEDGLLAIAERLMEHYDGGYDVMGEAIIDAFADVQKLFQHVVEAAHMEGAAFEASRREEEMQELRRMAAAGEGQEALNMMDHSGGNVGPAKHAAAASPGGSLRLDEFVDQDVKDILTDAIRKGTLLRDANKHRECLELYESACQNASSLLPVDSDNRGRLHLSMARAESMSPDRACAILRYAMDDVLRSGMKAGKMPMPDVSKRSDLVLIRPTNSMVGNGLGGHAGAMQSADEALNSLIEEMKEILSAPVYEDTPLQAVAKRFWAALHDSQKLQQKNEDRLEQQLAKLKGEFLLAKSEWEEKLNQANEQVELYKGKCDRLRREAMKGENYMDQARQFASRLNDSDMDMSTIYGSVKSGASGRAGSVASLGSGLAQQAKTLVSSMNNFNCGNLNERASQAMQDFGGGMEIPFDRSRSMERSTSTAERSRTPVATRTPLRTERSKTPTATRTPATKAYQDYTRSPQRIDV